MSLIDEVLGALDPANSYILKYLNGMQDMDKAAVATSLIPGVGDVMGAAADVSNMVKNPEERNLTNLLWLAAGAAPFVPSRSQTGAVGRLFRGEPADAQPRLNSDGLYWLTPDSDYAADPHYGGRPGAGVKEFDVGPRKLFDPEDEAMSDWLRGATKSPVFRSAANGKWSSLSDPDVIRLLKENGFDGFKAFEPGGERSIALFSVDGLQPNAASNVPSRSQVAPIKAYHGSPHDFDKFSMDAIGTGEGAQAYGHGLYFAESEDVARGYRDELTMGGTTIGENREVLPADMAGMLESMQRRGATRKEMADALRADLKMQEETGRWYVSSSEPIENAYRIADRVEAGESLNPGGRMYEVNINASPDEFLDWDKPLSEQSEKVRKALEAAKTKLPPNAIDDLGGDMSLLFGAEASGGDFLGNMQAIGGRPDAGETLLRESGVKGVRYKDGFSRGAEGGTSNYVVFDDSIIEIAKKYGLPPVLVAYALQRQQTDEEI